MACSDAYSKFSFLNYWLLAKKKGRQNQKKATYNGTYYIFLHSVGYEFGTWMIKNGKIIIFFYDCY